MDGRFRRRVALKLARTAWDHSFSERLNRERNMLESLEHPHIARFLDAGQDKAGRPCLALEHADGQAIDAYGEEHRLGIRERLRLLLQVCEAVAYAHTQLVIHRDLKPADILVTPQGQVKLLDFGIAKLMEGDRTSETALTALSGHVLTLDSASPELTGARPHRLRRGSAAELEEAIAHADAPRASDVATERDATKAFRGDLDAILDKALRKRTADRYLNVESLADDLLRHLDHVPVQARPPSRWYLARRYATRHRTAVAAATGIMLALGIGLGPSLWQADAATRNERIARQALDRERAVQSLLVETLAVAATADPAKLREPDGFGMLLQAKFDEFEERFKDRPEQWLDLLEVISNKLPSYGDYACSLAVGERYLALLKKTKPADPVRLMRPTRRMRMRCWDWATDRRRPGCWAWHWRFATEDPAAVPLHARLSEELQQLSVASISSGDASPKPSREGSRSH